MELMDVVVLVFWVFRSSELLTLLFMLDSFSFRFLVFRYKSVFSSVVSNSESGQCHARDPTRIKLDELSLTHDLGTCETPYEGPNVIHAESQTQD